MTFLLGKDFHLVGCLVHAGSPECLGKLTDLLFTLFLSKGKVLCHFPDVGVIFTDERSVESCMDGLLICHLDKGL